jgi:hypothetical protein
MTKPLIFQPALLLSPTTSVYGVKRKHLFARDVRSLSGLLFALAVLMLFGVAIEVDASPGRDIPYSAVVTGLLVAGAMGCLVAGHVLDSYFERQERMFLKAQEEQGTAQAADDKAFEAHWAQLINEQRAAVRQAHPNWHPLELVFEMAMENIEDERYRARQERKKAREDEEYAEKVKYGLFYL